MVVLKKRKKTLVTAGILERTQDIPHDQSIYGISTHMKTINNMNLMKVNIPYSDPIRLYIQYNFPTNILLN